MFEILNHFIDTWFPVLHLYMIFWHVIFQEFLWDQETKKCNYFTVGWGYEVIFLYYKWLLYDLRFWILYHADNIHSPTNNYILYIGTTEQTGVQHPQKWQ